MDPAQVVELHAKRHHKPMDDLIERGDSPVQQFYSDTTVFVTGGSGFLGKQLIEKLLRSCKINKLYLLMRAKNGKTIQERLQRILREPVFDRIRETQPQFVEKIVPIEGDVADIRLGLNDKDWIKLTEEVQIIIHEAATVNFNEPLRKATLINVRGTRETLTLAKNCSQLKKFIHVSTAFTHATLYRINTDIPEKILTPPVPPDVMIAFAEETDSQRLDNITNALIQGWPNTYTFTKVLAEDLIRSSAGDIPVCIVRPSIVLPSYFEPNPGWLDLHTIMGPSGIVLGTGLGVIRVMLSDVNAYLWVAPVDYVNNATIAAGWDSSERHKDGDTEIPVYYVGTALKLGLTHVALMKEKKVFSSPKTLWYTQLLQIKSKYLYYILLWFFHLIPAYVMDLLWQVLGKELPKGVSSFVDIYKKMDKLSNIYNYFIFNHWNFEANNIKSMVGRMTESDKDIFNCDVTNIDLREYSLVLGIGLRKYILKDELRGTTAAYNKQKIFRIAHYIGLIIYISILWLIFTRAFGLVSRLLMYVF